MIGELALILIGVVVLLIVLTAGINWLTENVALKSKDKDKCCKHNTKEKD